MTERRLPLGMTPRLLSRSEAGMYCGGIGPAAFEARVPVRPILIGNRRYWDVKALDRWLDQQSDLGPESTSAEEWLRRLDRGDKIARR